MIRIALALTGPLLASGDISVAVPAHACNSVTLAVSGCTRRAL